MSNCKGCKKYSRWDIWGVTSWCNKKNCYISRPRKTVCGHFEENWLKKLLRRFLNVRKMMSK